MEKVEFQAIEGLLKLKNKYFKDNSEWYKYEKDDKFMTHILFRLENKSPDDLLNGCLYNNNDILSYCLNHIIINSLNNQYNCNNCVICKCYSKLIQRIKKVVLMYEENRDFRNKVNSLKN